jgi:hypothetical protein
MRKTEEQLLSDEAYALLAETDIFLLALKSRFKRKLVLWCIRTCIGAVLFGWLAWQYPWGRWVLVTWIPLCLLSLGFILYGLWMVPRRYAPIKASLHRLSQQDTDAAPPP